jgi:hypothetical protein
MSIIYRLAQIWFCPDVGELQLKCNWRRLYQLTRLRGSSIASAAQFGRIARR